MGNRRRLRGGFKVWLPDHRLADGIIYRRYLMAGADLLGPHVNGNLRRVELHQYAVAGTVYEQSARLWAKLAQQREHGKGRKPDALAVRNAAKRLGLAQLTLTTATSRLEALAARHRPSKPASPTELLDSMREQDA